MSVVGNIWVGIYVGVFAFYLIALTVAVLQATEEFRDHTDEDDE